MSTASKWKYESGFLLPSKLGQWAARTKKAHVMLVTPGEIDFMQSQPYFTIRPAQKVIDHDMMSFSMGKVAGISDVVKAIRDFGPDVVIVTANKYANMLGTIFEADTVWRNEMVRVPLIMWDIIPDASDITERGQKAGGRSSAAGFTLCNRVWFGSGATQRASLNEIQKYYGFSATQHVIDDSIIVPACIDRAYMMESIPLGIQKRERFTIHIGGRWSGTKGYAMVTDAITAMRAMGEQVDLVYTGDPGSRGEADRRLAESQADIVKGLTQEGMWGVSSTCHIGVLSQDAQAMPCLPMENLALGLPVLVRSTDRLLGTYPQYPLIWADVRELMALIKSVKDNYALACHQTAQWFEANWQRYDITSLGDDLTNLDLYPTPSVPIEFDSQGVVSMRNVEPIFATSIFARTMARREAARIGNEEHLEDEKPRFDITSEPPVPE